MFVDSKILRERNAENSDLRWFEEKYPKGTTFSNLLNGSAPTPFLHWCWMYLDLSEDELKEYEKVLEIENTASYCAVDHVKNSFFVSNSSIVENSNNIDGCEDVHNSEFVYISTSVENSKQVSNSNFVYNSSFILRSDNITDSMQVLSSNSVINSSYVNSSSTVVNSDIVVKCENVDDVHFCQNCKNISNALFCYGVTEATCGPLLFNKQVSDVIYRTALAQYKNFAPAATYVISQKEDISPNNAVRTWYSSLSPRWWKWLRTLTNFDPMIIYHLTFNDDFLDLKKLTI